MLFICQSSPCFIASWPGGAKAFRSFMEKRIMEGVEQTFLVNIYPNNDIFFHFDLLKIGTTMALRGHNAVEFSGKMEEDGTYSVIAWSFKMGTK
jgi:hypothetical protein